MKPWLAAAFNIPGPHQSDQIINLCVLFNFLFARFSCFLTFEIHFHPNRFTPRWLALEILLTYKSIDRLIEMADGNLIHQWAPVSGGVHIRTLWMEIGLCEQVMGARDYRIGQLWADFDRFCLGGMIVVGSGNESSCFMKRLSPTKDEIWEIRSKDPKPQIRVFGRFAAQDVFVATHLVRRDELGNGSASKFGGTTWAAEIQRCKHIWRRLFQSEPPHSGDSLSDYISENTHELNNLP